jgi:hypothetical protein
MPSAGRSRCRAVLQIRFDIKDGQPQVTVAGAPVTLPTGLPRLIESHRTEVNQALREGFPLDALRSGRTGDVHALLEVDP